MSVIVLIGAPGSGKGTQGDLLVKKFAFTKVSTGDLLREHIKNKSALGKQVEAIIANGNLVSDDLLLQMIKDVVAKNKDKTLILDGYPRNKEQASALSSILGEIKPIVLHIKIDERFLERRLLGRRVCNTCGASYHIDGMMPKNNDICDRCGGKVQSRSDDLKDKVVNRLAVYRNETTPVLAYYEQLKSLQTVDGSLPPMEVHEVICTALRSMGF